jgi:hypothetical protein
MIPGQNGRVSAKAAPVFGRDHAHQKTTRPGTYGFARAPMLPVATSGSHEALPRSGALHL